MTPEFKPDLKIIDRGEKAKLGFVKLFNGLPVGAVEGVGNTMSCEEGCNSCFDPEPDCEACFDPSPDVRAKK